MNVICIAIIQLNEIRVIFIHIPFVLKRASKPWKNAMLSCTYFTNNGCMHLTVDQLILIDEPYGTIVLLCHGGDTNSWTVYSKLLSDTLASNYLPTITMTCIENQLDFTPTDHRLLSLSNLNTECYDIIIIIV